MPGTTTQTDIIERTIHIDAKPETVYALLSDPDRMAGWSGRSVTMDPRPGGLFRIDYNGFDIMRGEFVELDPPSRVVFTWGWESLADQTRPGASTVTVTLEPEAGGTRLHLRHEGLAEMDLQGHGEGWDFFLGRLATVAAGGTLEEIAPPLTAAGEYASKLNALLVQARFAIEAIPDAKWKATTSENRAVNALAGHIADHIGVLQIAQGILSGEPSAFANVTLDDLEVRNAERDAAQAAVTRDEVLGAIRTNGPQAVEAIKAMSDADLSASMPMAFAG
ncbi:MAG: SRPBCC family protein, partial [Tepidiformaceae bacterium]